MISLLQEYYVELILCALAAGFSITYAATHWTKLTGWKDNRGFEDRVQDVRAMNTYNSYMFAGILVFLAIAASSKEGTAMPREAVYVILAALVSVGASLLFVPLGKPEGEKEDHTLAKLLWLKTLIFSQFTLILTIAGIVRTVLGRLRA